MLSRRAALTTSAAFAVSAATGCATQPRLAPAEADAQLNAFLEEVFDQRLTRNPQLATSLGDRRGYQLWDDRSDSRAAEDVAITVAHAADMQRRFDVNALSPQARLSYDLFQRQAKRTKDGLRWRGHTYWFNQMFGAQTSSPTFLINQHRVADLADAQAYVERLRGFRAAMGQVTALSEASAARGITPPRFVFDYTIPAARAVITGAPFTNGPDSPLLADATAKINRLTIDPAAKAALLAQAQTALKDSVLPAYEALIAALERQKAAARTTDGVWALPDGDAFYQHELQRQTTTTLSADAIHAIGLEAVARLHGETQAVMAKVGFAGDRNAFFRFMESDPRFYEPDTPEGRASYIRKATAAIAAMKARCSDFFNLMPKAALEVRAVEAFREKSAGLAFYERPSADGLRPGVYYANTQNMKALPLYQLEALAYHEGIPGHHFQIAIAQELNGLPRVRRFGGGFTVYSEGWALYTERLAKEMGFYQDPYSDFGRIVLELRRAIRLVVDTGLHAKRWSRQQAIQYILDNQPGDEAQARLDIDRYIVMPGQATAYLIGQMKILELREKARAAMGARFDIKTFHDAVLGSGAVPLDVLENLVMGSAKAN
jgi:uncharacterized protein (DUF885 family)